MSGTGVTNFHFSEGNVLPNDVPTFTSGGDNINVFKSNYTPFQAGGKKHRKSSGKKCKSITELGSRHGDSTVALLNSQPETMVSYDLFKSEFIDEIKLENYKFITDDTLKISIEETDLLFIDTLHRYFQLYNELGLHAKNVRKYIILHDTETYGLSDEPLYAPHIAVKMSDK